MHISFSQIILLKKISKVSQSESSFKKKEHQDLSYLGENGLISYESVFENERSLKQIDSIVHITPKGKTELEYAIGEILRWLIPLIISIAALIVSICAIFSSSQSIEVYIDNQKTHDFTTSAIIEITNAIRLIICGNNG